MSAIHGVSLATLAKHRRSLARIARDAEACRTVIPFPYRLNREPRVGDLPPLTFLRLAALMAADRFAFAAERYITEVRNGAAASLALAALRDGTT